MESIWTIEQLDDQIAAFKTAMLTVATSQEYRMGDRSYTRADLPEIRNTLKFLAEEKQALLRCGSTMVCLSGVPRR